MENQAKALYYANLIEKPEFNAEELKLLNIHFMKTLDEINLILASLGITKITETSQLIDYGYALAQVGSLANPAWIIYPINFNFEFVSDIWNKKNFYVISKSTDKGSKIIFEKVHMRERALEQDLKHYIDLDIQFETGPYPVFSEYIQ